MRRKKMRNIFIIVLLLAASFFAGRHQARVEIQEEVTRIETKMQEASEEANNKLKQEKQNAQAKIDALKSDVADGTLRLYVRTSGSATTTDGASENGTELDRQIAQDLISITADGDKAIIQLNSCIDLYNTYRTIK
jgi:hypothetical protein